MTAQKWRVWGSVLLGLAVLTQVAAIFDLITALSDIQYFPLLSKVAFLLFVAGFVATVVALIITAVGRRRGGLIATAVALATAVASVVAFIAGDLTQDFGIFESLKAEVLGIDYDYSTNGTLFFPSTFFSGLPTWALLAGALVVLALAKSVTSNAHGSLTSVTALADPMGGPGAVTPTSSGWYPNPTGSGPNLYWDGQQWLAPAGAAAPQTSGMAIAALILAFLVWPVGLIMGYVARNEIRNSGGTKTGSGVATAAIVLGWIGLGLAVIYIVLIIALLSANHG